MGLSCRGLEVREAGGYRVILRVWGMAGVGITDSETSTNDL